LTALPVGEDGSEPAVDDVVRLLRRRALSQAMAEVTRSIRRAEESGDADGLVRWLAEKQRLAQELARSRDESRSDLERDSFGIGPSVL
jgi:hypothetical protein